MRDIKTREKSIGTIKTIDRASMLSHRMKQASVKAKDQAIEFRAEDERNESAYAEENTLSIAGSGAVLLKDSGVKGFRESGHIKGIVETKTKSAKKTSPNCKDGTLDAIDSKKDYGKDIRTAKESYTISNGYYGKSSINATRISRKHIKSGIKPTNSTIKQIENGEKILKKQYQIKQITQNAKYRTEKSCKKILASLKRALTNSEVLTGVLAIAGSIAIISIIVCTFFGSAFYILGDGNNPDNIPEGFEGIGDGGIVEVAASQIGNVGGAPYWSWYGFDNRVEWCACFVSWCANQCGYIQDGIIPKFAGVGMGISWFQDRHQWQKRGYHPKPGDIVFFDWEGDGYGNHVGIVESSDDTYVYTIEGNSGDKCCRRTYFLHSSVVMGYGIPKYKSTEKEDGGLRKPSSFSKSPIGYYRDSSEERLKSELTMLLNAYIISQKVDL